MSNKLPHTITDAELETLTIEQVEELQRLDKIVSERERLRAERRARNELHMPTHRKRSKYGLPNDD